MADARNVVLCADLGTGSLRVGAITATGAVVAAAATAIRAAEPQPGRSVIDAEVWWRALARTVGRTLGQLPQRSRVQGLCLPA
jgi:sugar (pentulose or hexulose) kinase